MLHSNCRGEQPGCCGAQAVLQGASASPVDGVGRHTQPAGLVEGLRQASVGLRSGFSSAAQAAILRPARSLQEDGIVAALGTLLLPPFPSTHFRPLTRTPLPLHSCQSVQDMILIISSGGEFL